MKTLQIEVTEADVALLQSALDAYEAQSVGTAVTVSMMSAMFCKPGPDNHDAFIKENEERMEKATNEGKSRKMTAMRLRLKLMEAVERPTEFSTHS